MGELTEKKMYFVGPTVPKKPFEVGRSAQIMLLGVGRAD